MKSFLENNVREEVTAFGEIYVKRFQGYSKAQREFAFYKKLQERSIPTPPLVGVLQGKVDSFLITMKDGVDAATFLKKGSGDVLAFLQELALFVNMILDRGLDHGDLKLGNLLLAEGKFKIIDVKAASLHPLSEKKRRKAYAQILHSLSEVVERSHLLFFLEQLKLPRETAEAVWKKMHKKRMRRFRKEAR